jgi:TPR repeat protein
MKLQFFYVLLLLWSSIFAQNEFEQDHNAEVVENNDEFSPDETEQNPSEAVAEIDNDEHINVDADSVEAIAQNGNEDNYNAENVDNNVGYSPVETEQYPEGFAENTDEQVIGTAAPDVLAQGDFEQNYNIENVDKNTVYGHVDADQNPSEGLTENEFYNGEQVVETDALEIQTQNVENNVVETEQHFNEVAPLDSEQYVGTDPIENLAQNEFEKDYNTETFENNGVYSAVETEQNPVEVDHENVDHDENNAETDATEILAQDELEQNYNAENVGNGVVHNPLEIDQYFTEVVPKYEVDANEHDVGSYRREIQDDFQQDDNGEAIETNVNSPTEIEHDDHLGTDFIEILGLPETISTPNLRSTIRYSIAGPRILVIEIFTVGVDHIKSIFHTEWTEVLHYAGEIKAKLLRVTLPDNFIYKEDKILHISPDLHSESLLVRACIVDYENPSVLLLYAEHPVKLTPPWSRLPKYSRHSCNSWIGMFLKNLTKNKIPKCPKIDDVVELLSFPVAIVGNEQGYRKFFQKLRESEELQNRPSQFTLATWLYLTKRCSKDMCPLLYHIKETAFQTPLIGLLKSGHLHLQFHYEDGSGYAFLFDAQIPIHKWIHITVTVKHTVVSVYVRYGKNLEHVKTFVHSDFPAGLYHYNDTDGYWGLGGSPGFISAHGFIGPARIYRRHVLSQEAIETIFTVASRPDLEIVDHFKSCRKLKTAVKFLLRKESKAKKHCSSRNWLNDAKRSYCNVGARGLATEIVSILIDILNINETSSGDMIQQKVYEYAFNLTKTNENYVKDILLLSYSSCLGHPQSLYLLSVLYRTGLGVIVNPRISQRSLLLASYYNHPLSQMSLAYKHYIGVDGFPKDHEVASTYYRYAAVESNRVLVEHNEVDTHSEAVRLDKKEDLENYRGPDSNWFSWLIHQAKRGVTDAQSALGEVFYYGSRGFRRNLTKAAEFYEMGANRGDAQMLFNLGVVKLRGQGVAENADEARDLLKKSAELGFAPAHNALGYYELNVRHNKSGAVEYFRFAAEHEDRDGLYNLGFALENGLAPGTVGDLKSAMPYYIGAANKGHTGACVVAGDAFSMGQHVDRDVKISIIYYKFVADQIPEIGLHLRSGLDGYFEKAWYQSLLYYLLAAEAGMEIAQYNAALLCEWDWELVSQHTRVDCTWRYYNHSAKLEWVPSLIKTGDNHWFGITAEKNITTAARLYSQAATKEQNPQAIYNLGYLVENNYPLDGLDWMHFHLPSVNPGNLTLAAALYRKCRDSSDEALVPCSLGLVRVAVKMAWQLELVKSEVLLIPLTLFIVSITLLYYLCRLINNDRQMIDLA